MKILVTGGSGFIGTNFIQMCKNKKYEVINLDIKEPQSKEHLPCFQKVDICDFESLYRSVMDFQPEYIVHLAARTDLEGKSIEEYKANTIGVENLLKIIPKLRSLKKVIITSSMLVCSTGYQPQDQFDYNPSTFYGESKVMTEKIVWNHKPECDWAIIRPTSIWGPWFGIPYRNFFDMVIAGRYFHIGNKSCTKTYGYIENAVYEIEQIMLKDTFSENNKVFYIGDYEPVNIEMWADEIGEQLNRKIIRVPYWIIYIAAKIGDVLKGMNIIFPMTSFRLKNMTTDNVVSLNSTKDICGELPVKRVEGIKSTLRWMKQK